MNLRMHLLILYWEEYKHDFGSCQQKILDLARKEPPQKVALLFSVKLTFVSYNYKGESMYFVCAKSINQSTMFKSYNLAMQFNGF